MPKRRLISFDWALKKLLRSKANFEILEGLLSELLKDSIHILEVLESESNKETRHDKYNRVDLKVKNQNDEIIIIEVQYEREFDYLQRILYGTSKAISEHLNKSDSYSQVIKVISVNILYFDLGQGQDYIYHGTSTFKGLHKHDLLQLSEEQQKLYKKNELYKIFPEYYLIKVNNFDDIARDSLDEWIYFLKNEEIKENFNAQGLKKAKVELDILKLPEKERLAYERYQDDLHYQASMVESSYTIGMIKGEEKGIQKGIEKGIQKGIQKGIEQGEKKKAVEIAKNLIDVLDIKIIAMKTGLTEEEVDALCRTQ